MSRQAGAFFATAAATVFRCSHDPKREYLVDSKGNLYVGDVGGAGRVQKFVLQQH